MNTPNPLQPQGALPKDSKSKNNIRIAVFTILAVHVVLLLGLLMQGCKREEAKKDPADATQVANALPALPADSPYHNANNLPPESTTANVAQAPAAAPTSTIPIPPAPTTVQPESVTAVAPAISGQTKEYVVIKGDSYFKIAKAHGISIKALAQANPGVDPDKLKINQKLQVPAAAAADSPAKVVAHSATPESADADGKLRVYQVKAGDSLVKIAKQHGTSIKAIQAANNLKTSQIRIGQKLKVPTGKSTVAKGTAVLTPSMPMMATSNAGALRPAGVIPTPAQ